MVVRVSKKISSDEKSLTDASEDLKLVHRRISTKVDASIFFFFRRVRATSVTQRRVENSRVHFGADSPVSVKLNFEPLIFFHKFSKRPK